MVSDEIPDRTTVTLEQRKEALARAIQGAVARGGRIESQSETQAVIIRGQRPNHVLHLILSLITVGVWAIVWLILVLTGGEKRELLSVDEFGNVLVQKV